MIGLLGSGRPGPSETEVVVLESPAAMANAAAWRVRRAARVALATRGLWRVSLAGGQTPRALYRLLTDQNTSANKIDWSRTEIFFDDERAVAPDHPESNYGMVRDTLLDHVPIPAKNVHRMEGEGGNLEDAAATYQKDLDPGYNQDQDYLGRRPTHLLDLAILGMGADGHTASLFPHSPALDERRRLCVPVTVPGHETWRLTLTLPVFESAREIIFLVAGSDKAHTLRDVLNGRRAIHDLPSMAIVHGKTPVTIFCDRNAASELPTLVP